MSATVTVGVQAFTSVDVQTVFYNRGTISAVPPNSGPAIAPATSRILPGNLVDNNKPGKAQRDGTFLNTLHGSTAFVNFSGYRWRQYRTLTVGQTYTISPRRDCESTFVVTDAGTATVAINLTHTDILPGMAFKFERPTSAGDLVINLTNGNVMSPATGGTGTTITVTQYGSVVLRLLGSAVSGGPKVMIESGDNYTVS